MAAAEMLLEEGAYSRVMGATEHNWCRAIDSGTGITVLGLLFCRRLDAGELQLALNAVVRRHPRLRSQIRWIQDDVPAFLVQEDDAAAGIAVQEAEDDGTLESDLLGHVEAEMNTNAWKGSREEQVPVLNAKVIRLQDCGSLFLLRVHTGACDRVSMAVVMSELLHFLRDGCLDEQEADSSEQLVAVEDAIPKGQANKPFWAHGVDLLGYSLGSFRHALLPFDNPEAAPQRSELIRAALSVDSTRTLLERCKMQKTDLVGALSAAGLKATAKCKQLGSRGEHFAIVGLVDCRKHIDLLASSTVGFYHSAVLNTHHVSEASEFWDVARRCSDSLNNAVKNRKHFTDMGDINYLMHQALQHPNLTPASSLRTSLMVVFQDALRDDSADLSEAVGLQDYVGCASVHGVGPALAVFHSIRNGGLVCNFVYAAPLYARPEMQRVVDLMLEALKQA